MHEYIYIYIDIYIYIYIDIYIYFVDTCYGYYHYIYNLSMNYDNILSKDLK
jgi:hypothetical protein